LHPFAAGDPITVLDEQEYYFEGYVRDETGSPVQGVRLVCEICDVSTGDPPGNCNWEYCYTNSNGYYEVWVTNPGGAPKRDFCVKIKSTPEGYGGEEAAYRWGWHYPGVDDAFYYEWTIPFYSPPGPGALTACGIWLPLGSSGPTQKYFTCQGYQQVKWAYSGPTIHASNYYFRIGTSPGAGDIVNVTGPGLSRPMCGTFTAYVSQTYYIELYDNGTESNLRRPWCVLVFRHWQ